MKDLDFDSKLCEYQSLMFKYAVSLTHNYNDALDIVQDVNYQILKNRDKFESQQYTLDISFVFVRNRFISLTRKSRILYIEQETVYIPVENTRIEYKDKLLRDLIYLHDSIFTTIRNDTIYLYKYKTLYRDRIIRDSILKNDTIRQPYPVIETKIENRLNFWQRIIQGIGYSAIGLFIGWGFFKIRKRFI